MGNYCLIFPNEEEVKNLLTFKTEKKYQKLMEASKQVWSEFTSRGRGKNRMNSSNIGAAGLGSSPEQKPGFNKTSGGGTFPREDYKRTNA
jgi:hypothetical protein